MALFWGGGELAPPGFLVYAELHGVTDLVPQDRGPHQQFSSDFTNLSETEWTRSRDRMFVWL